MGALSPEDGWCDFDVEEDVSLPWAGWTHVRCDQEVWNLMIDAKVGGCLMGMKILLFVFAVLALALPVWAQQPAATRPPKTVVPQAVIDSLEAHPDLVYATYGDREMQLDLYRPKGVSGSLPAIVCIHGGGWKQGQRQAMTPLAQTLASKGYVGVTISYRLRDEAIFPAAIQDCKAAVRWLRANAEKYGIDKAHIGATGLSAGGHLAALLATSGGVKELEGAGGNNDYRSDIQACVAAGAQSDLESERIQNLSRQPDDPFYQGFLGGTFDAVPEQYALASPLHHLSAGDPPLAFACGEMDDASTHGDVTRAKLEELGIPTGLLVIPGAPHGFTGGQPWFDQFIEFAVPFFDAHLKGGVQ